MVILKRNKCIILMLMIKPMTYNSRLGNREMLARIPLEVFLLTKYFKFFKKEVISYKNYLFPSKSRNAFACVKNSSHS